MDKTEMATARGDQRGQHRVQQMQHADVIDLEMPLHLGAIKRGGAHRPVVAGAVHDQRGRALRVEPHALDRGAHAFGLRDVQRQRDAARLLAHEAVERIRLARRHDDARALP
jgi:hypothetical protein